MKPSISPQQAKFIYDRLPGRKSLAALHRELVRRGKPVSLTSLRKWKANNWQRISDRQAGPVKASIVREAKTAAEHVGLPVDVIRDLEARLTAMSDGELVVDVTRRMLTGAGLLMEMTKQATPDLMLRDPRGLAALHLAAARMVEGAHDLMREARNIAERAMKEKCGLLLPSPEAAPQRPPERTSNVRAFAGLLQKFAAIKVPGDGGPGDTADEPVQYVPPVKTVN